MRALQLTPDGRYVAGDVAFRYRLWCERLGEVSEWLDACVTAIRLVKQRNVDKAHIVDHSMGGPIALVLNAQGPSGCARSSSSTRSRTIHTRLALLGSEAVLPIFASALKCHTQTGV